MELEYNDSVVCTKKCDIQNCNNYRGNKLLSHYKSLGEGGRDEDEEGCVYLREPI